MQISQQSKYQFSFTYPSDDIQSAITQVAIKIMENTDKNSSVLELASRPLQSTILLEYWMKVLSSLSPLVLQVWKKEPQQKQREATSKMWSSHHQHHVQSEAKLP